MGVGTRALCSRPRMPAHPGSHWAPRCPGINALLLRGRMMDVGGLGLKDVWVSQAVPPPWPLASRVRRQVLRDFGHVLCGDQEGSLQVL